MYSIIWEKKQLVRYDSFSFFLFYIVGILLLLLHKIPVSEHETA